MHGDYVSIVAIVLLASTKGLYHIQIVLHFHIWIPDFPTPHFPIAVLNTYHPEVYTSQNLKALNDHFCPVSGYLVLCP